MRSDAVKKGIERAPHRAALYGAGVTEEDFDKPFIGIINSKNTLFPGHGPRAAPDNDHLGAESLAGHRAGELAHRPARRPGRFFSGRPAVGDHVAARHPPL